MALSSSMSPEFSGKSKTESRKILTLDSSVFSALLCAGYRVNKKKSISSFGTVGTYGSILI